jgi:hypothetical protein
MVVDFDMGLLPKLQLIVLPYPKAQQIEALTIAIGWCDSIVSSTKLKSPSLALDIGTIFTGKFCCTISCTIISLIFSLARVLGDRI